MGRTLHYSFKPASGRFTGKELEKLYDVGKIYYERCEWTCEAFGIDPYDIYPNWEKKSTWDALDARRDELSKQGVHPNKISQLLVKEKIANFHHDHDKPQFGFSGFTKTGSNELNSLQVVMALLAASRVVKNAVIGIHDEGKLLKCRLILQNGLAMPDREDNQQQIGYLLSAALFDSNYAAHKEQFIASSKELYDMNANYQSNLISPVPSFDIAEFCRPINPEDFENHPEYGAAQIMAGFEGEYFGLSTKDAEAESYRMIASIQKLLPDACNLVVAPKI